MHTVYSIYFDYTHHQFLLQLFLDVLHISQINIFFFLPTNQVQLVLPAYAW